MTKRAFSKDPVQVSMLPTISDFGHILTLSLYFYTLQLALFPGVVILGTLTNGTGTHSIVVLYNCANVSEFMLMLTFDQ